MNGLMALPNLIGLLLLSGFVLRETRSYFERFPGREGVKQRGGRVVLEGFVSRLERKRNDEA